MRRNHISLIAGALLAACSSKPPVTIVQPDIPVVIPAIDPLSLASVQWQVLTVPELKALVTKLEASHNKSVLFLLDTKNYNNLSANMVNIQRYISEQKTILDMLKTIIIERTQKPNSK